MGAAEEVELLDVNVGRVGDGGEERDRTFALRRVDEKFGITLEGIDLLLGDVDALEEFFGRARLPGLPEVGDALGARAEREQERNHGQAEALRQHGGWHS